MIPLPRYRADEIRLTNRIFTRRAAATLPLGRDRLGVTVNADPPALREPVVIEIDLDGRLAWLEIERALAARALALGFPELDLDGPAAELAPMLLEASLAPLIAGLEQLLTRRLRLRRLGGSAPAEGRRLVGFDLRPPQGHAPLAARLWLEPASLPLLAQLLELLPLAPAEASTLPIEIGCWVGRTRVGAGELRTIRPADLLVVEATAVGQGMVDLVIGRTLAFRARVAHNVATITDKPRRLMAEQGGADAMGDLESVPVTLVFELGRVQMALGELRALAPGYSFDLGKDLRAPVDILANGQKIGTGELIQIDERIGVRVSQLAER